MELRIALAGNPNCGKTTLFNALTGSNQSVGNWPGVTVEKKEGRLKHHDSVVVCDLPGIYSLSPYTNEEVIARNYLVGERPDVILNIIDGTTLERSLYLTTQLAELGIPVVVAVNMMDVVRKRGDSIDTAFLSRRLSAAVVELSALKGDGVADAVRCALAAARAPASGTASGTATGTTSGMVPGRKVTGTPKSASGLPEVVSSPARSTAAAPRRISCQPRRIFCASLERALAHIAATALRSVPAEQKRWYAIKVFERDREVLGRLDIAPPAMTAIEAQIAAVERELDDDAEAIIANERYVFISALTAACCQRGDRSGATVSDRIDAVVTNRWLGLPIFAAVMFFVYYISMVTMGTAATAWVNDGLFGDGFHLFALGSASYEERVANYDAAMTALDAFGALDKLAGEDTGDASFIELLRDITPARESVQYTPRDGETPGRHGITVYFSAIPEGAEAARTNPMSFADALSYLEANGTAAPEPGEYGVWVPGVPVIAARLLAWMNAPGWLGGLVIDGIIAGVGAVLGFVPQLLVLFAMLAFLEACGYMARIAFVLDRVFRRFGLTGKSFIPILIGTGCSVPAIMASRTIESESDRRMTIITATFIPCGAKVPLISMIAGALFGGSAAVATSAYLVGIAALIVSAVILKKTGLIAAEESPFVMELPAYHMPTVGNVLCSTWERGRSFIRKAGSVILLSTVVLWLLTHLGRSDGAFALLGDEQIGSSLLARAGEALSWIFAPLGWGNWRATVASMTGLIAKENIVGTLGVLCGGDGGVSAAIAREFTRPAGYSFLVFNLLCAPCFAAMGAIRREMNSARWTAFAIAYQCVFAYAAALVVNQLGSLFGGGAASEPGVTAAFALLAVTAYILFGHRRGHACHGDCKRCRRG